MSESGQTGSERLHAAGLRPQQIESLGKLRGEVKEGKRDDLGIEGKRLVFVRHLVRKGKVTDLQRPGEPPLPK